MAMIQVYDYGTEHAAHSPVMLDELRSLEKHHRSRRASGGTPSPAVADLLGGVPRLHPARAALRHAVAP